MIRSLLSVLATICAPVALGAQTVSVADGAILRAIDKVTGQVQDLEIDSGGSAVMKRLTIRMDECRYPTDNPSGDAFAHLQISDANREIAVFEGWMVASSPALNPLDHPRYDVWVLRCKTPSADSEDAG